MSQSDLSRAILCADVPLIALTSTAMGDPPSDLWRRFQTAGEKMRAKDRGIAIDLLRQIATSPSSSSQAGLLAWKWLRDLHVPPDGSDVKAVVIDEPGANLLALYADGSASQLIGDGGIASIRAEAETAQALSIARSLAPGFAPVAGAPAQATTAPRITLISAAGWRSHDHAPDSTAEQLLQIAQTVRSRFG